MDAPHEKTPDRPPAWTNDEELKSLVARLLQYQEPDKYYGKVDDAWISEKTIPELRDLIEAFQTAAESDPKLKQRLIPLYHMKSNGTKIPPLVLRMRRCTVASCECYRLDIRCELIACTGTFEGEALFRLASFARDASFRSATFDNKAWFDEASFGAQTRFNMASFIGGLSFYKTSFHADASFDRTEFSRAARFDFARFYEDTSFRFARFVREASFEEGLFRGQATFFEAVFRGDANFYNTHFYREVYFSGATFNRPFNLRTVDFHPQARLGFNDVILGAGADILLSRELVMSRPKRPIIVGEDSKDADDLKRAAVDYNLLRDLYRSQPGTDDEEDECHIRYMKLKRRTQAADVKKNESIHVRMRMFFFFFEWCVYDKCLAYLVRPWRIAFAGGAVVLGFAILYGVWFAVSPEGAKPIDYIGPTEQAASHGWGADRLNPLYFSIMSFVTLGYGDFAPIGWLKLATGMEAFFGVSLIALFTVAWGRKMIR